MADRSIQILRNSDGQSVVEYILLLLVIVSLSLTIYNNPRFREFLGPNSEFFTAVKDNVQYSYRHGLQGFQDNTSYNGTNHPTYFNDDQGQTRFFIPRERYPAP